ncbi:hypothetical protein [Paraburkholderia sp. RL17-381-BIF-C]|uniref:hypothetical protein n=1 Tax=Paraburkholderia sp. RL17-381-BIF-C TaxID=3031635 RepID=UPI0038B9E579
MTDADIAREHRLCHLRGSALDSISNPALRICLANCAELRKKRALPEQTMPDGKSLAAGDTE